jgi:hypothetical protein
MAVIRVSREKLKLGASISYARLEPRETGLSGADQVKAVTLGRAWSPKCRSRDKRALNRDVKGNDLGACTVVADIIALIITSYPASPMLT